MSEPVRTVRASDYAGLDAGPFEFYYGYEWGRDDDQEVWGFQVKHAGIIVYRIAYDAMAQHPGCPLMLEPQDCLLFGIGLWLATGGRR